MRLPANRVLCTIGTPCTMSAVGSTETHRALVTGSPAMVAFAALDAGLVDVDLGRSTAAEPSFVGREGPRSGEPLSVEHIDALWGARLRESMGIRRLLPERMKPNLASDL